MESRLGSSNRSRETCQEAAAPSGEAIGGLDQGGGSGGGEKWIESRHILNELSSE